MLRILPRKKIFSTNGFGRLMPIKRKVLATPHPALREKTSFRRIPISSKPIIKEEHRIITRLPSPTHDFVPTMPPPHEPQGGENDAMWKRFDYIGIVCYTGYRNRYEALVKELDRVGIRNFHVHWDFPSPYKELLLTKVPMVSWNKTGGGFYVGLNNYRALSIAYYLGKNSCLIMEDDVRFLKDINLLQEVIESLPADYDLAMLDHNDPTFDDEKYLSNFVSPVSKHWSRFQCLSSSGCYAMSARGMKRFLSLYETPVLANLKLKPNDCYFNEKDFGQGMNLYAATTCPAMQKTFKGCHGEHYMERYYNLHALLGMDKRTYEDF